MTDCPGRNAARSASVDGNPAGPSFTRRSISARVVTSARDVAMVAPFSVYASSVKPADIPAFDSMSTWWPALMSGATLAGTSATRRSPGHDSRTTPIIMIRSRSEDARTAYVLAAEMRARTTRARPVLSDLQGNVRPIAVRPSGSCTGLVRDARARADGATSTRNHASTAGAGRSMGGRSGRGASEQRQGKSGRAIDPLLLHAQTCSLPHLDET